MSVGQGPIEDEDIGTGGRSLAFTTATAPFAGVLIPGRYYLYATQDVWVKRGTTGVTATKTIASEFLLKAGVYWPLQVRQDDIGARDLLAAIGDTASGTLYAFRVSR